MRKRKIGSRVCWLSDLFLSANKESFERGGVETEQEHMKGCVCVRVCVCVSDAHCIVFRLCFLMICTVT